MSTTSETAAQGAPTLAFRAHVREVIDLGAGLRRLVLGGEDLAHFGLTGPTLDLRFKIVVPHEGSSTESIGEVLAPLLPHAPGEWDEGWYQRWLREPVARRGVMRTYTVRALRDTERERLVEVDLVLHGIGADGMPGPGCGPAAEYAAATRVGDILHLIGPNRAVCGPEYGGVDFRPGTHDDLLLVGDETAAPAICAVLEQLPRGARGMALIEIPGEGHVQRLAAPDGVSVRWLVRSPGQATGELLLPAARDAAARWGAPGEAEVGPTAGETPGAREPEDIDVDAVTLWEAPTGADGGPYAWIAGEAGMVKELRRHLVRELGVDRRRIAFMGYWRQGRAGI